ncbi:phosphatase PAP2 family protein [Rugamonas apoptosis]|uniref:Phosphatase PAP2 family protein n=1 Tax=Rugamonas apoptosis TaxID=2758570 RepID=A0A7W2IJD7_9BURK|nr:phosphatase PAP2 family protein [Rugamonas apoptosis]MBA5686207.1 phosphatase PAP2 family protein [Rugamonas apoptosis]
MSASDKPAALGAPRTLSPLAVVGATLTIGAHWSAGTLSVGVLTWPQVMVAAYFTGCYALLFSLLAVLESVRRMRRFRAPDGRIDVAALWRAVFQADSAVMGCMLVFGAILAISGNANLVQIYRSATTVWYDPVLWQFEQPLWRAVLRFRLVPLAWWESIYHLMWLYVLLVLALLVKARRTESSVTLAVAIVLAFYGTTAIALRFPVAGPEYYHPASFAHLRGTLSGQLQAYLQAYQAGRIAQNGLLYGTMAMPSLHVAITAMATWFVGRHWPRALCCAVPLALLIWASTIVLGWHYALDGVAALALAALCVASARAIVRRCWRAAGG